MPRNPSWDEPDDCFDDDWDDQPEEDPSDTVPCPACGMEVYEDAVRCPECGEYLTHDTRALSGRPMWWILLGILGILATLAALLFF